MLELWARAYGSEIRATGEGAVLSLAERTVFALVLGRGLLLELLVGVNNESEPVGDFLSLAPLVVLRLVAQHRLEDDVFRAGGDVQVLQQEQLTQYGHREGRRAVQMARAGALEAGRVIMEVYEADDFDERVKEHEEERAMKLWNQARDWVEAEEMIRCGITCGGDNINGDSGRGSKLKARLRLVLLA